MRSGLTDRQKSDIFGDVVYGWSPNIGAFMQSDIYSFSLVMWEILRKTRINDDVPESILEYALPYHNLVESDPNFETMKKVVAEYRPEIPKVWSDLSHDHVRKIYSS